MTKSQRKALEILLAHDGMTPREFALAMWPDSPGWDRYTKCGPYGSVRGGAMPRAGGAYLGKLRRLRWAIQSTDDGLHRLSLQGFGALQKETRNDRSDTGN